MKKILVLWAVLSYQAFATMLVPIEWQDNGKLRNWARDRNGNFVDDLVEAKTGKVDIVVDLNQCTGDPSTSQIVSYLKTLGDVAYIGKYVSFIIVKGVDVHQTYNIAKRSEVAAVELALSGKWRGDNFKAVKIETSSDYKSNTLEDKFGWSSTLNGQGVNIAFLDTGVKSAYDSYVVHGYDAVNNVETNPGPETTYDHASWMASWVFGSAGIAPKSGLVDIKVGTANGIDLTHLARALDKVYEKRKSWAINVVTLMFSIAISDGQEAICQQINLLADNGIVMVASAGDNQANSYVEYPAAASRAIAVSAADIKGTVKRTDDTATYVKGPRMGTLSLDALKPELNMPTGEGTSMVSTSIAAAMTSGLVALILQENSSMADFDNKAAGSVKDLLIRTAEAKGTIDSTEKYPNSSPTWNKYWGFGEIDAFLALQGASGQTTAAITDLTFTGFDNSAHPSSPWFYSHALKTQSEDQGKNITAGVADVVYARIYNNGNNAASNVRVNFGFYQFTAGIPKFYDIGSVIVPMIKAQKDATVSIAWTPPTPPAGHEHGCIMVTIDYGYDSDFSKMSNFAQKNVQVKKTSSPAVFHFGVENPLPDDVRIDLKVQANQANWTVKLSETSFFLKPGDCAKTITATVEPMAGIKPGTEALFFITAYAAERSQANSIEIGGVALKARFEGKTAISLWGWVIAIFVFLMCLAAFLFWRGRVRSV